MEIEKVCIGGAGISLLVFVMCMVTIGCSSGNDERRVVDIDETTVTLIFSPYQMEVMTRAGGLTDERADDPTESARTVTRAATSIAGVVSRLDVWIMEGGNTTAFHQVSTDDGFGAVTTNLDKTKTYTLVTVGHNASGSATLTDGVVAFPDDKVTQSMIYTTTFSPATTTALSCEMQRIVGRLRIETADAVPDDVKKITVAFSGTGNRWNVSGTSTNVTDRTATFNITSTRDDGTVLLGLFVIPANLTDTQYIDLTVSAMNADDDVLEQKQLNDVPIKAGYQTSCLGTLFTTGQTAMTFTVDDWLTFDTINF